MTSILYTAVLEILPHIPNNHPPISKGGSISINPVALVSIRSIYNVITPLFFHAYSSQFGESSISAFYHIFMDCPTISFVHTLDLKFYYSDSAQDAEFVPKIIRERNCNRLRTLSWTSFDQIFGDVEARLIAEHIPTLESLRLDFDRDKFEARSLNCFNHNNLPYLRDFSIWCLNSTKTPNWVSELSQLKKLHKLRLGSCWFYSDLSDLDQLLSNLAELRDLSLENMIPRLEAADKSTPIHPQDFVEGFLYPHFEDAIFDHVPNLRKFYWSRTMNLDGRTATKSISENNQYKANFFLKVLLRFPHLEELQLPTLSFDPEACFEVKNQIREQNPFFDHFQKQNQSTSSSFCIISPNSWQQKNLKYLNLGTTPLAGDNLIVHNEKTDSFLSFGSFLGTCFPALQTLCLASTHATTLRNLFETPYQQQQLQQQFQPNPETINKSNKKTILQSLKIFSVGNRFENRESVTSEEIMKTFSPLRHLEIVEDISIRLPSHAASETIGENRQDLHLPFKEIGKTWRSRNQNSLKTLNLSVINSFDTRASSSAPKLERQSEDDGKSSQAVFNLLTAVSNLSDQLELLNVRCGLGKLKKRAQEEEKNKNENHQKKKKKRKRR